MPQTEPDPKRGCDAVLVDEDQEHTTAGVDDDAIIGVALRWSLVVFLAIAALTGIGFGTWHFLRPTVDDQDGPSHVVLPTQTAASTSGLPKLPFTNITGQAGIDFEHASGATGEKLLPETMGSGCAFFDFDSDGDQDLLLVNGTHWPWTEPTQASAPTLRLYANDATGHFHDATESTGLDISLYGTGVAVGDYDNDGFVDVFLSAVGENRLLHNEQGKSFRDVTAAMGVAGDADRWSTSCGWLDYDNDGEWSREIDLQQGFQLTGIGRAYGPPTAFAGTFPYLYRNDGKHFTDVSQSAGLRVVNPSTGEPVAKSLAVAPVDIDEDGWIDLIVANDTVRNLLFHNQQDGTFAEIGTQTGVAFDPQGKARGAMGIDAARFRNDDCLGVAVANFANEMTALYVCLGDTNLFTDDAIPTGLGPLTRLDLSFGLLFFDADLDGRLDLLSANGHLEEQINQVQASQHYRQPTRLFWNAGASGPSEFVPLGDAELGPDFSQPIVGRGAAYADIDGDGDLDLLVTQTGGTPLLLRNDQQLGHHYLRLKLVGTTANRDAIGAWVDFQLGSQRIRRQVMPTRSYLSQVELPLTIGLGQRDGPSSLSVSWPGGGRQLVHAPSVDLPVVITQADAPPDGR